MPIQPWERLGSRPATDYRIFRSRYDRLRSPHGQEADFVVLEMPDWVNVVALTEDRQLVLVRQIRHGLGVSTLEIPGGMVDPGEDPGEAVRRELLEETGYEADHWEELGWVHPNPAIQTNRCTTFLARGCRQTREPSFDHYEDIDIEVAPVAEMWPLVRAGAISHSLVVVAFTLYERWLERAALGEPR